MNDVLQYEGKRVIVTGAASGMGAATAQILVDLGAEVHAIDIKKPEVTGLASFSQCDLRDPAQIDETIGKIGKIVNALFNCAGLPNTFPNLDVMLVNFCGLRQVTESVIPLMIEGSSIASIASTAGIGWMQNMELLFGLMMTPDFAGARADLRRASALDPKKLDAYYHLGLAHYFLREFAEAGEAFVLLDHVDQLATKERECASPEIRRHERALE